MAAEEIHLDDIGTVFEITLMDGDDAEDVSSATVTKDIIFRKPGGTKVTQAASFTTDGTDGKIEYTSVADDLDEVGAWNIQAYLILTDWTGHSDVGNFTIHRNL